MAKYREGSKDATYYEYYIQIGDLYVSEAFVDKGRETEFRLTSFALSDSKFHAKLFVNDYKNKFEDVYFIHGELIKRGMTGIRVFEMKQVKVNTEREVLVAPKMTPEYVEKLKENLSKHSDSIKVSDEEIQLRVTKDINDSYNG